MRQSGWASCPRCQGLHHAGFADHKGVCPDGGPHEQGGSFVYVLDFDVAGGDGVQQQWASCPRCQGLHYAGFADHKGVCPDGGPHRQGGSFRYALRFGTPAEPGWQAGWRSCRNCQGLFYGPFGGVCPATGTRHDGGGSFDYLVAVSAEPFIALRPVQDGGRHIEVTGRGFTGGGAVTLGYLFKGADDKTSTNHTTHATADAQGALVRARIPVTITDLHYAQVRATDDATGRTTVAEHEAA